MRSVLSLAFFMASFSFVLADEPKEKKDAPETKSVKEQLLELSKKQSDSMAETRKKLGELKDDQEGQKKAIDSYYESLNSTAASALKLAKDNIKDESAFEAAMMAMQMGQRGKTGPEAMDFLVENFTDSPKLVGLIPMFAQAPDGDKTLEKIAAKSTKREVKGVALFAAVEGKVQMADYPRGGPPMPAEKVAAIYSQASGKLDTIVKEFGDVKMPARGKAEVTLADAAKKVKFFVENLTVGKVAPEVECELLDGKKQKLSDLRGKVVVLDIWATWCGPCRAMIPHERELTERLKDKPFVLVSVSADQKKETLTKFLEEEKMPWTHWWNGATGGLIEKYQVQFYPTIYVLDHKGVIRFKHTRGKEMDEAVESLLKEMAKAAP